MQSAKSFSILFFVVLLGFASLPRTLSSITDSLVIKNTGSVVFNQTVTARSGSSDDIQAAVDEIAAGGGAVYIPSGTFDFIIESSNIGLDNRPAGVKIPGGVNIFGAGVGITILRQPIDGPDDSSMFTVDGRNGMPVRISGISFRGWVSDESIDNRAIAIYGSKDFRVDHCEFIDFVNAGIITSRNYRQAEEHRGVIDHNFFDNPYKDGQALSGKIVPFLPGQNRLIWGYGIIVTGTGYNWEPDVSRLLGRYGTDTVYIEDNVFSRTRHAIASNAGGWYVARHNTFIEPRPELFHMSDVHGSSGTYPHVGGRGLEAYDNTFIGCPYPERLGGGWSSIGLGLRGGGGVIFNNTFIDTLVAVRLERESVVQCQVKDLWIWGSTLEKQYMTGNQTAFTNPGDYIEGVDFSITELGPKADRSYTLPGLNGGADIIYTPYVYPHPLTLLP